MEAIQQIEKIKSKTQEIMNYLHNLANNIEQYSTFELERIIKYTSFNPQRTLDLIENYAKEEIIKMIEDYDLKSFEIARLAAKQKDQISTPIHPTFTYINIIDSKSNDQSSAWKFLQSNVNIIDMKDLLNSYDQFKLIKRAKSSIKDKNLDRLDEYFESFDRMREQKVLQIFKASLEDNDIKFLEKEDAFNYLNRNKKKAVKLEDLPKNYEVFYDTYTKIPDLAKNNILDYLDIFSLNHFSQTDRTLQAYINNKYTFELPAKKYCLSIFKNSNLYVNEQKALNQKYKTYLQMLTKRPRIRFAGIYYCRVKKIKGGFNDFGDQEMHTSFFYRYYRFLPDGFVYSITTPYNKRERIISQIIKKDDIQMRQGRFLIDEQDMINIEMPINEKDSDIYRFKVNKLIIYF